MKVIFCPYLSELKECPCEYEQNCIKKAIFHLIYLNIQVIADENKNFDINRKSLP